MKELAVRSRKWLMVALLIFSQIVQIAPVGAQEQATGRKRLIANELDGPLLEVHFLDVGQGDAMYIRTPGQKHYLIDTGTRSARKQIIPYLKYLDVKELDGVILSHRSP
jgi:beta-lactamase superfamily II metal-dependent hydrolase